MDNMISRAAVLDEIHKYMEERDYTIGTLYDNICEMPSAQPSATDTNVATTDSISRWAAIDAAIEAADDWDGGCNIGRQKCIEKYIRQLPPIQPKRGKWIHHPEIGWGETWLCDQCGEKTTSTVMGKPRANFCPNCGADMRGEQDE